MERIPSRNRFHRHESPLGRSFLFMKRPYISITILAATIFVIAVPVVIFVNRSTSPIEAPAVSSSPTITPDAQTSLPEKKNGPTKETKTAPVTLQPSASDATTTTPTHAEKTAANVTITVNSATYPAYAAADDSLLDVMQHLRDEHIITFTSRDYPGLGTFIDSINGTKAENGSNWILYINGTEASKGASSITVHSGDSIEWKLEKNY